MRQSLTRCGRSTWTSPPFRPRTIKTDRNFCVKPHSYDRSKGHDAEARDVAILAQGRAHLDGRRLTSCPLHGLVELVETTATNEGSAQIAQKQTEQGRRVLAETRRRQIAEALRSNGAVTVAEVEALFGVSPMTARRDLDELERRGLVRRTHGGAVLPATAAHEDSFARRMKVSVEAKQRLAEEAVRMLSARETVFLDSSTTSYFVARRMIDTALPATVLTNSLPVMELIFNEGGSEVELIGIGGTLRRLTRSFVGPFAVRTVQGHFADRLFLSVKGVTETGMMTDADALEAEVKRAMIAQAGESTLLIDGSKMHARGLSVVASVADLSGVLVHGVSTAETAPLVAAGASVQPIGDAGQGSSPAR